MAYPRPRSRHSSIQQAALEVLERRTLLATTYYVSPTGSDGNSGTSTSAPFKTLAKVNTLNLNAGDQVLLQGGQTFSSTVSATNLTGDPGFENRSTSIWNESFDEVAGSSTFSNSSSDVHGGVWGLRVSGSSYAGRGQNLTGLKPGQQYLFKAWAKALGGSGKGFVGVTFKLGGVEMAKFSLPIISSSWREYRGAIVAPEQFDHADIWCIKLDGSNTISADDFSLSEIGGGIALDASDSGTAANPVVIGSYGVGRATIAAGDGIGISLLNVSGVRISNLNLTGNWNGLGGTGTNSGYGVLARSVLASDAKLDSVLIDNLDASGFKYGGIVARGELEKCGFTNLRITNCAAHDNGDVGIEVRGVFDESSTTWAHSNLYIGWCRTYNNGGLPGWDSNTGSGIKVGDVNLGTIERCISYNNGQLCDHPSGGPIGIWCWDSNSVTIQNNESYANRTFASGGLDGGGFDIDGGCTNCILQYNYSHDNDGAGFLLYQFAGARPFSGNVVRYNISQNDGRHGEYAGIYLGGGSEVVNNQVHNNTVYVTPSGDSGIAAMKITGVGSGNKLRNNIFITTGGVAVMDVNANYSTSSVQFLGNEYYSSGSSFVIKWGSTNYASLSSWRGGAGQEKNGSLNTGLSVNPMLVSAGGGATIGDAARLHTLTAYQLLSGSALISAGAATSSSGPLLLDYYGATSDGADIGAFEWSPPTVSGSAGSDTIIVRRSTAGTAMEVFNNVATSAVPSAVWASGVYDAMTIAPAAGDDIVNFDNVTLKLSYFGGGGTDRINLTGAAITFQNDAGAGNDLAITVGATASATIKTTQHLAALSVDGAVSFAPGSGTLLTKLLSVATSGRLDLNDNDLMVDYTGASPFDSIRGLIYRGYSYSQNSAAAGITSTVSQLAGGSRLLVLLDNVDFGKSSWHGQPMDGTTLFSLFTYFGDLNVDGRVTSDDLIMIDSNFNMIPLSSQSWFRGDANLDGRVTGDDYIVVDTHLGLGT